MARGLSGRAFLLGTGAVLCVQGLVAVGSLPSSASGGGDNAAYLTLAHSLASGTGYVEAWDPDLRPHAKYPPMYPAILAAAMRAGLRTWTQLKLVSVAFMVGSTVMILLWLRERTSAIVAFLIALPLVVSPAFVDASGWVLSEPPFLFFTFAAIAIHASTDLPRSPPVTIVLGLLLVAALFTRTAGIALVAAFILTFGIARRWRDAGVVAGMVLVAGIAWLIHATGSAPYASELLLRHPYRPEMGRAGMYDIAVRIVENAKSYALVHLPAGLVPVGGWWRDALGIGLVTAAGAGWWHEIRKKTAGPVEYFLPLYGGLLVVWPWHATRFALPLIPVVLFYAVVTARSLYRGRSEAMALLAAVALTLLGFGLSTREVLAGAGARDGCRRLVESEGPWACDGAGVREFEDAARFAARELPAGSVVLSRSPHVLYFLGGVRGSSYERGDSLTRLLEAASTAGAGYVLLDRRGGRSSLMEAQTFTRPDLFCEVARFRRGGRVGFTTLLALRSQAPEGAALHHGRLEVCPPRERRSFPGSEAPHGPVLPILARPADEPGARR